MTASNCVLPSTSESYAHEIEESTRCLADWLDRNDDEFAATADAIARNVGQLVRDLDSARFQSIQATSIIATAIAKLDRVASLVDSGLAHRDMVASAIREAIADLTDAVGTPNQAFGGARSDRDHTQPLRRSCHRVAADSHTRL